MKNMKILFFSSNFYYPQLLGGTETSTHDTCLALLKNNITPFVLCGLKKDGFLTKKNRLKSRLLRNKCPSDKFLGYEVFRTWFPEESLDDIANKVKPDIVVVIKNSDKLLEKCEKLDIPCVLYLHSVDFVNFNKYPFLHYIANSQFTARKLKEQFNLESNIIPPWVDPARYRVKIVHREHVLFVNPHPGKGIEIVFELAKLRPDIPFVIVESWPLPAHLQEKNLVKAKQYVNIQWKQSVVDMRTVYKNTKILLTPSIHEESWGRVVTEAHINGIPVISSNKGGLPEAVGDGGIIINTDIDTDISQWSDALSRLWDNPDEYERYSIAAKKCSDRIELNPQQLIKKFINILNSIR